MRSIRHLRGSFEVGDEKKRLMQGLIILELVLRICGGKGKYGRKWGSICD